MKLSEISFPVFRLNTQKPSVEEGVLYYMTESFNKDTAEFKSRIRIVDDTTLPFETLSRRRLQLKAAGAPVYPLKRAVFYLADLVKLSSQKHWWIDSAGKIFQYIKTGRAKLTSHKIAKILPLKGMGYVIDIEGISQRFKVLYKPAESYKYATIINGGINLRFLYGLTEEKHQDSWRVI